MKSFQQFLSESINIAGDFNGNLYMSPSQPEQQQESFLADVVWQGRLYRMQLEGKLLSKNELAEQLQSEYPGAIVHNVYPTISGPIKVKKAERYRPECLSWEE